MKSIFMLTNDEQSGKLAKYDALENGALWESSFAFGNVDSSGSKFTILENGHLAVVSPGPNTTW